MILFTFVWSQPNAHKNNVSWISHPPQFYTILGAPPPPKKNQYLAVIACNESKKKYLNNMVEE